jgi:hypothetical protein
MAEHGPTGENHAPDTGTHSIHLPPPSIWPLVLALGITFLLTGLVLTPILLGLGVLLTVVSLALWVRDAFRQYRELPTSGH